MIFVGVLIAILFVKAVMGAVSLVLGGLIHLGSERYLRMEERGELKHQRQKRKKPGKYWDQSGVEDFLDIEEF